MSSLPQVAAEPGLPAEAPLVFRTVACDDLGELLALLPPPADPSQVFSWVRRRDGLVGWGHAATYRTSGADRFTDAERWWQQTAGHAVVRDAIGMPGTGPICFGSFTFAPDSEQQSVLVVPEVLVGRRAGRWWVTTATAGPAPRPSLWARPQPPSPQQVTFADGALSSAQWEARVADAVARIARGELDKVVLARDLLVQASEPVDPRRVLRGLAGRYDNTWVFAVDGVLGATPELLVRRERGLVTSRVLAGTIRRSGDDARDLGLAASLARSSKDLEEHEYAARSVAEALAPHCSSMNVPESPFVLHLPNVMHLATDVTGVAASGMSSLSLAAALHPTAAVGGTPTDAACEVIAALEGMDRGRYAGPVGWMDTSGDGEWGIALRSGCYVAPDTLRIFAGCGIVAGSDPEDEVAESDAKLLPMRDALSGR